MTEVERLTKELEGYKRLFEAVKDWKKGIRRKRSHESGGRLKVLEAFEMIEDPTRKYYVEVCEGQGYKMPPKILDVVGPFETRKAANKERGKIYKSFDRNFSYYAQTVFR